MTPVGSLRPTSAATQLSLTRLAGGLTAVGLLWLALWVGLAPPEDVPGPWLRFALVSAALAIPAAASTVWPDLPGARWTPVVVAGVALATLAAVSHTTALIGWWPAMELAALLALATSVALPTLAAAAAQAAVLATATVAMLTAASPIAIATGPAAMGSTAARLLVAAGTVLIGNALLRRASAATDELLTADSHQREVLEEEERRRRSNRDARRFLHDSGMNSLEAVSRGVPPASVPALRERCARDAARWLRSTDRPTDDVAAAFGPALQEANIPGLTVNSTFRVEGRLPAPVLTALAAATGEALRNCAKHAQVDEVTVEVTVSAGAAAVLVADDGRGFDPAAVTRGLGVENSIRRRMLDAGGEAQVDSSPGAGTRVLLRWPTTPDVIDRPGEPTMTARDLPESLARLAWWPIAAVAVGAVASTAVNWWSVHQPWLLAVSGLVLAGGNAWFVHRWRSQALDTFDIAVLACTLVIATLLLPVADPFCSAASGPPLIPDGRVVALMLVGVLLASWRASALVLSATLGALVAAAVMWHQLLPLCAPEAIPTGIGLTLAAATGVAFGRAVRSQEAATRSAFAAIEATNLELARRRADALVRAEWGIAAVAEVRDLLRTIAHPATDLDDPSVRRSAGDAAARLRTIVRASELPTALATAVAQLTDLGRSHGFRVTIEGDVTEHDDATMRIVSEALSAWVAGHLVGTRAASVTLSDMGNVHSVLVHLTAAAPMPDETEDPLPAPDLTVTTWHDEAGNWWQAEWPAAAALIMGYPEPRQSSR